MIFLSHHTVIRAKQVPSPQLLVTQLHNTQHNRRLILEPTDINTKAHVSDSSSSRGQCNNQRNFKKKKKNKNKKEQEEEEEEEESSWW